MQTAYSPERKFNVSPGSILFISIHIACLLILVVPFTWLGLGLCLGFFFLRKFAITAGYHRYFSHRSYKTSRLFQFLLAFIGGMSTQKGAIWWAANHRHHHKYSDRVEDIHSVDRDGFYWAHVGWVLSKEYDTFDQDSVKDLTRYPELVFLDKLHFIPPITLAAVCVLTGWWTGGLIGASTCFVWGYLVSTVILYHTTFSINSLCHKFGSRRYETGESSKNSLILALITLGEGWHNNHHHYPLSTRQGFFWWEIDITYYILKVLSWFRIVWSLQRPPRHLTAQAA
ncbi:MAG: acyl-CoA desaturase [Verrucomicrobiae bacterium]|nr:acyl-CoA desaturase [Verrucomicrobiae bacterium]